MGQLVGATLQFTIGDGSVRRDHGHGSRARSRLLLEQRVDAGIGPVVVGRAVPALEQRAFVRGEERNVLQRHPRELDLVLEDAAEVVEDAGGQPLVHETAVAGDPQDQDVFEHGQDPQWRARVRARLGFARARREGPQVELAERRVVPGIPRGEPCSEVGQAIVGMELHVPSCPGAADCDDVDDATGLAEVKSEAPGECRLEQPRHAARSEEGLGSVSRQAG